MTPTANAFEDRLLDALLDRFDTMAHPPAALPASLPRRASLRRGSVAVGCLAATVALTVVLLEPGSSVPARHAGSSRQGPPSTSPTYALAAWNAEPTLADQTQIVAAEDHCASSFGQAAASQPAAAGQKAGPPEAGGPWSPELVDTRGDLTLTLYSDGTGLMDCLNTSSFVLIGTISGTGTFPVTDNSATLDYMNIRGASGVSFTVAVGRIGSAVSGVSLQRIDGSEVAATVGDGHFIAWWPEGGGVNALAVTASSGTQSFPVDPRFEQTNPPPSNNTVHQPSGSPSK